LAGFAAGFAAGLAGFAAGFAAGLAGLAAGFEAGLVFPFGGAADLDVIFFAAMAQR
jgi:hypothetical protein